MTRSVRVSAVSPAIRAGRVEENLRACEQGIAEAVANGSKLIVLPELATSGYAFSSYEEAESSSMAADDDRLLGLAAGLPRDVVVVIGFAERLHRGLANSVVALTSQGPIGSYRKTHLWGSEPDFFVRGDAAPPVVPTPFGRLGLAICYDIEFPEVPRSLKLEGAELLASPVAWPLVPRPDGERAPELVLAMASARANRLPIVIADHSGSDGGVEWTAGTAIIDGDGWVLQEREPHALADVQIPADSSAGPLNDLIGDRRPEIYLPLGTRTQRSDHS